MADIHWFDRLNLALVRRPRRRQVLAAAGVLLAGLLPGSEAGAGKKRGGRRQAGAKKSGRSCSKGVCNRVWKSDTQRQSCEETCKRCKRTRTEFCIKEGDPNNPAKVADCCPKGEPCCGNECCPPWKSADGFVPSRCCGQTCCPTTWDCCDGKCCPDGDCCPTRDLGKVCLESGYRCCPDEGAGFCGPGEDCCPGEGCVPTGECVCANSNSSDACCGVSCGEERECCPDPTSSNGIRCAHLASDRNHCGTCGNACGPYPMACCFGECRDTSSDVRSCKVCSWSCQPGQLCIDGNCEWPA